MATSEEKSMVVWRLRGDDQMGVFLSEYNDIDIDSSMGSLELQLLIETSFYKHPSVCFKLCRRDDIRWCLLWKYENNINDYYSVSRDVTRELGKPEMKMAEIMKEPVFIKKMKEFGTTYSYELSEDDALIIKEFLEKRLPSVSGHKQLVWMVTVIMSLFLSYKKNMIVGVFFQKNRRDWEILSISA